MSQQPSGWYDDPSNPDLLRYWDGVTWTSHTAPKKSPTASQSTIGQPQQPQQPQQPSYPNYGEQGSYPPPPAYPSQPLNPAQPLYQQPGAYPPPGAYPQGYPPYGMPRPHDQGGGLAIAGLVLGIISMIAWLLPICGGLTSIIGIVLSALGRRSVSHRTMATVGLVLSIIALVLTIANAVAGAVIMSRNAYPY